MTSAQSTLTFVLRATASVAFAACGPGATTAASFGNVETASVAGPSREESAGEGSRAALIEGVETIWGVSLDGLNCQSTADGLRCECPDEGYGPFSEALDQRSDGFTAGRGEWDWESHFVADAPNNMPADAYVYGAQCDIVVFDIYPDTREPAHP